MASRDHGRQKGPAHQKHAANVDGVHGLGTFNLAWDSRAALNTWVSKAAAPQNPVGYNGSTAVQARPLYQYPTWLKYKGHGDIDVASSFSCVTG
jgi:Tannase and feruloyl esterase